MTKLMNEFRDYLEKNLALEVETNRWNGERRLPMLFRDRYDFHTCKLLGIPHLLMIAKQDDETTPASIRKHADIVMDVCECEVIYVTDAIVSYNRKRLIEHKVSFVVPGNQLYLPILGMDLREHIRAVRKPTNQFFSPATQAVVLHALYSGIGIDSGITPMEFSKLLNYTKMTLTRVFDELESVGLAKIEPQGRERVLQFPMSKKELWAKARPYLRTPVRRTSVMPGPLDGISYLVAGESALSEYTMLGAPSEMIVAMTGNMWKNMYPSRKDEPELVLDETSVTVEIWSYFLSEAPRIPRCVDPLSLYLSIGDTEDARIEAALDELLERIQW